MIKNKRSLEGYLLIDHRNSPGLTPEEAAAAGSPLVRAGHIYESATITCSHCQTVVVLNPDRTRPRNYCGRCDHYVCDNPICISTCRPIKQIIEEAAGPVDLLQPPA